MRIEDKVSLLEGKDVWHTNSVESEDIKSIMMCDGPHGVRKQVDSSDNLGLNSSYQATLYPAAATVACSFNKEIAEKMGRAIGIEARSQNVQMVLGPGINIKRNPLCGRNFEYYSEDPYLAGSMGASWIKGLQSQNVGASLKHFAANNQETFRFTSDSIIDERALREIYLKGFEIAIQENPATVMCSYNKLNGTYASENKSLLTDILRNEWGFKGVVVSDWGAVSNRVIGLKNGLDLEMPSTYGYNPKKILDAYKNNNLSIEDIDKSVDRVKNLINQYKNNVKLEFNSDEHHKIVQEIGLESIVLLKNEGILPLKSDERVAIVGAFAKKPRCQGGGSSFINPIYQEVLLDEIDLYTSNYQYFEGYNFVNDGFSEELIEEVVKNANKFDKIIIMTGLPESYETEGFDRKNIDLPLGHLKLIEEVTKINTNVIITLYTGSQVALPFDKNVKAIVNCHLLGAASGKPLLDILYGKVSPSGRLATTYPFKIEDDPSTNNFGDGNNAVWYEESIYVGYRYYTTFKKDVLYPFGYGLSYTDFEYSDLTTSTDQINLNSSIIVSCKIKNIGLFPAKEVVQLYIENNKSSVFKPLRELKKYEKIHLKPDEEKTVSFKLVYKDFCYYDTNMKEWHVNKGVYKVQICKNVNEIILEKNIEKLYNEPDYIEHKNTNYNNNIYYITSKDFEQLLGRKLPPKNIIRKRPYTMDATLLDLNKTLLGKILRKFALREANKINKDSSSEWMREVVNKTVSETPLRTLATMSGGVISLKKMEGILDIINYKFISGVKKL